MADSDKPSDGPDDKQPALPPRPAPDSKAEQARAESAAGPSGAADPPEEPEPAPAYEAAAPTLADPFNFPSNSDLPAYDEALKSSAGPASAPVLRPIAIPQLKPGAMAPLVSAYSPVLLQLGVTAGGWRSFLGAVSGFLTARVSERAVDLAVSMARQVSRGPRTFGKDVASHARAVGRDIATNARRRNVAGTALGVLEGAVSIPVLATVGAAGAALRLPGSAMDAVMSRPQTPLQRANAYAAVANREWLHARGLQAVLVTTAGLAPLLEMPVGELLNRTRPRKGDGAAEQLRALEPHASPLEVDHDATLLLSTETIWLVLLPVRPRRVG